MQNSFEVVMVFESRLSCLKYPTSIDPTVAIGRTINIIFEFRKPPDEEQVKNVCFGAFAKRQGPSPQYQ